MPLPDLEKTITLERAGAREFSVSFLRIPGMTYQDALNLGKGDAKLSDEQRVKKKLSKLIVAWNIEGRDGEPFDLPSENPDVIFTLPDAFIEVISEEMALDMMEGVKEPVNLPKRNENNLAALS